MFLVKVKQSSRKKTKTKTKKKKKFPFLGGEKISSSFFVGGERTPLPFLPFEQKTIDKKKRIGK